jgi:site-specific DNA recombinase
MREDELSERLGELLKGIHVPEAIAAKIVEALENESARAESEREQRIEEVQRRLAAVRARMDQMYEDKLDGKIDEQFWTRRMSECRMQERSLESQLSALSTKVSSDSVLTVQRVFELANRAHFLYLARNSEERGQLLKMVLLNCATDGVTLTPTYRKPFDVIFRRAKNEEWSGREDLNLYSHER